MQAWRLFYNALSADKRSEIRISGDGYSDVLPSVVALALSPAAEVWALRGCVAKDSLDVPVVVAYRVVRS